jgi:hypothetical protein
MLGYQQPEHPQLQCRILAFLGMVQSTMELHLPYRIVGLYVRMLTNPTFQVTPVSSRQSIHPERPLQIE